MATFEPTIASISLGNPHKHCIATRISAAAKHGFKSVEIVEEDINVVASRLPGGSTVDNQKEAARLIKEICHENGISILVLQPFWFYEGLTDPNEHAARIQKLHLWMEFVKILGTTMVQIPSNWQTEGTTGDFDTIVRDMIELAEIGLAQHPVVRFAYEAVAWGTYFDTWQGSWKVVKAVNRPNFGLCLDTFHIAGRVWGDPTADNGMNPEASADMKESLSQFQAEVDVKKIFYVQVGDAERLERPLIKGHPYYSPDLRPRMSWSRHARDFAFKDEDFMPIEPIVRAIVEGLGYRGPISMEVFSRHLFLDDPKIPEKYAALGQDSWKNMSKALAWTK